MNGRILSIGGQLCLLTFFLAWLALPHPAQAEEAPAQGRIFTFWPLVDYRESPADGFSNLSILGPLLKIEREKEDSTVALRPLVFRSSNAKNQSAATDYLYPLASTETTPDVSRFQILKLYQKDIFRKDQPKEQERDFMIFPFVITGTSKKYGPYTSIFLLYGDIYERFWRDEYHYVLFPLYGRTVKKGTTSYNVLYPFFNVTKGEKESGFQFWPLYGQAAKEGVYRKRFALWPFLYQDEKGLDTDNPTRHFQFLPLYAATDSPTYTSRSYLWPFFGHHVDRTKKQEGWDLLWPFWLIERGETRNVTRFIPLYDHEQNKDDEKRWYLWPLYKQEHLSSPSFRQDKDRVLYFLYSDNLETWPRDNATKRRTALWPLFVYNRSTKGVRSFSFPAPVEPVLDKEGIENNWAPLWRLYQQRWNDQGDSAASFLWNLYWHEARGNDLAFELFPLLGYRHQADTKEVQFLKGLVNYRQQRGRRELSLFWLPFGFSWGESHAAVSATKAAPAKSPIGSTP